VTKTPTGTSEPTLIDIGQGPAVLLLHGTAPGTTAAANFTRLLPALTGYRALAPDLLGFGASPKPAGTDYGPALWVDQAFTLLDDLGVDRVVLVGNSMGARVALTMAATQPDRVRGMVLMSARLHPSRSAAQDLIRAYRPDPDAMANLLRECFATDPATVTPEMVWERYTASAVPGAHDAIQAMFQALPAAEPGPGPDQLRSLRMPALVISGRDDRIVPFADALELAGLLPNADLHVLAGTGHWFPLERADTFAALVTDFLERLA
jgi:pimeloyl-ACP methyl ester carboxylesterase